MMKSNITPMRQGDETQIWLQQQNRRKQYNIAFIIFIRNIINMKLEKNMLVEEIDVVWYCDI